MRLCKFAIAAVATWLSLLAAAAGAASPGPSVTDVRLGQYGEGTRLVVELTGAVEFEVFALTQPVRLVVDLSPVDWALAERPLAFGRAGVAQVRFGRFRPEASRIVIDLERPLILGGAQWLEADAVTRSPYRLILDLAPVPSAAFLATVHMQSPESPPQPRRKPPPPSLRRLIALDPGHGGRDPGAVSPGGMTEKTVVLTFARELRSALEASGRYRVAMTRDDDRRVRLWRRVAIARSVGADVLLSIHVDRIDDPRIDDPRIHGASVYTLSEEASDAETAELARLENEADAVFGEDVAEGHDPDVAAALAGRLVAELGDVAPLLNRAHRFAEFRVLKAPDVPSVLIELGFLSSERDVERLKSGDHRRALAVAIVKGLDKYILEPC